LLKKPQLIALGVMVLATVVLLKLPSRAAANLKLAIAGFFLPAYGVAETAADAANAATYNVLPLSPSGAAAGSCLRKARTRARRAP